MNAALGERRARAEAVVPTGSARPSPVSVAMIGASVTLTTVIALTMLGVLIADPTTDPGVMGGALLIATTSLLQSLAGSVIEWRRPGHAVGRLLLLSGPIYAFLGAGWTALDVIRPFLHPLTYAVANWAVAVLSYPGVALIAGWVPLLFPTGALPGPRWRLPALTILVLSCLGLAALAFRPGPLSSTTDVVSPFGVEGWPAALALMVDGLIVELIALFLLAVAALAVRYRRGDRTERLQIRWLLAASGICAVGFAGVALETAIRTDGGLMVSLFVAIAGILVMPIAVGIAITRYRLYEIDRIVSRTISYAAVTAVLVLVFVGVVLLFQAILAPVTGQDTVAVAASTLIVAALFQPVRRRVQRVVDRRFNRARYDAQRTVESFAGRLRDQVELVPLRADLVATVDASLRPTFAGIWLRDRQGDVG